MIGRQEAADGRADISQFMVHLTRDDRSDFTNNTGTARQNYLSIFRERNILAAKAHCLHARKMTASQQKKCRVACFSATPLTEIKNLIKPMPGRKIKLESYGFVFRRDFLIENGAQPVTYVNSYANNDDVRIGYDRIFVAAQRTEFKTSTWRPLPFLSAMHGKCDFSWEREWRVLGDITFEYSDLICVILPETDLGPHKLTLARRGISWISPDWGLERIVEELSDQQNRTRRLKSIPSKQSVSRN